MTRTQHGLPEPGTFLRPIGIMRWQYAMRVIRRIEPDDQPGAIIYERWGLKNKRPFKDGSVSPGHLIELEPTTIAGVYRQPPAEFAWGEDDDYSYRWAQPSVQRSEVYFREIPFDHHGQGDLFRGVEL